MLSVNLKPLNDIFVQHPFASMLTISICLVICSPIFFYILVKIIALVKFFKGKR